MQKNSISLKITVGYALYSIVWIGLSDYFIYEFSYLINFSHFFISWGKGILFILFSSILLYHLLSSNLKQLEREREEIEKNKFKFQEIFNQATDFIFFAEYSNDGTPVLFLEVNAAACKALGYEREAFLNIQPKELIAPESWNKLIERTGSQDCSKETRLELTMISKHNERIFVEYHTRFFQLDGRRVGVTVSRDITQLKEKQKELDIRQQQLQYLFDYNPDAIYVLDLQGKFLKANPGVSKITGYPVSELTKMTFHAFIVPEKLEAAIHYFQGALEGNIEQFETEIIGRANERKNLEVLLVPVMIDGKVSYLIGMAKDITSRKQSEERIKQLAFYDELTGLPNGRFFKEKVNKEIVEDENNSKKIAILLFDINRFKYMNESLGFEIGDEIIRKVAQRLREDNRATVARIGGDKFAVMIANINDLHEAEKWAANVIMKFSAPIEIEDCDIYIHFNIGISVYPSDGREAETLLRCANMAREQSMQVGKLYQFYDVSLGMKTNELIRLENDLRKAIENQQLEIYYQPKIDVMRRKIIGAEALVRWNHPLRGWISPGTFIPLAEQTGLIISLGLWVLRTACEQIREWQAWGFHQLSVSINISAKQFSHPNFIEMVSEVLKDTQIDPSLVELEITESITLDIRHATEVLDQLKGLGVKISVDDFGTGYSSLNYLKRLPIDALKIDQSFIKDLDVNEKNEAIARTIVNLAQCLGLQVIAEGVETSQQLEILTSMGCHIIQGYLFSPPIPPSDLRIYLESKKQWIHAE